MFVLGLIIGLAIGGVGVAFYLNNIHSSKVKALEDKIDHITKGLQGAVNKN